MVKARKFYRLSYDASFLWKTALFILILGAVGGYVFFLTSPYAESARFPIDHDLVIRQDSDDYFLAEMSQAETPYLEKLRLLSILADDEDLGPAALSAMRSSGASEQQLGIAQALLLSLNGTGDEPSAELTAWIAANPPVPGAYFALGLFWESRDYNHRAGEAFEVEGKFPEAGQARSAAVGAYLFGGAYSELERLASNPDYEELLQSEWAYIHFKSAIKGKDWPGILRWFVPAMYSGFSWQITLVTVVTGLAWLFFLLHAGAAWGKTSRIGLCLLAVVLGMLSTWPTVLLLIWQEDFMGLEEKSGIIAGLIYYIAGVGLREETMKLLLFVPLVPFLLKRKNTLEVLLIACCVGLGFAAEENLNYFSESDAFSGPSRFLTANFFHISATGLTGLALFQMIQDKGRSAGNFATVFGLVVIAHGVYDALLSVPELAGEYSFFAMTLYILLCMQLFRVLNYYRTGMRYEVSLSWVFTVALSIVLAVTLGYQVSQHGLFFAVQVLASSIVGVGIIAIAFFKMINEPIH